MFLRHTNTVKVGGRRQDPPLWNSGAVQFNQEGSTAKSNLFHSNKFIIFFSDLFFVRVTEFLPLSAAYKLHLSRYMHMFSICLGKNKNLAITTVLKYEALIKVNVDNR